MTTNDFSNKTLYGGHSKPIRYFWAGYQIFVLLSSVIGDTTILLSSIKYRAIRLNKLIVVIIQHIAVCDLSVTLFSGGVWSATVSLIADRWVLGTALCYIQATALYYFLSTGFLLICSMTTCKLLILKYPLRVQSLSVKHAHIGCAVIWGAPLIVPAILALKSMNDVSYSYLTYLCDFRYSAALWAWLRPLLSLILLFIPNLFVVASTVYLLILARKVARRGRESLKWRGIMTTVLVATVYCISVLPFAVYYFGASRIKDQRGFFHNGFYRLAISCIYLNTISNFYIYCLTVFSFRKFLWSRIQLLFPCVTLRRDEQQVRPDGIPTQNRCEPTTSRQGQ